MQNILISFAPYSSNIAFLCLKVLCYAEKFIAIFSKRLANSVFLWSLFLNDGRS